MGGARPAAGPRLLECRAYAAAADVFVALAEQASRSVPREVGLDDDFVVHAPDLLAGVTPDDLAQAYLRGSAERPVPRVDLSHVTVDTVSVSEAVAELIADARRLPAPPRSGRWCRAAGPAWRSSSASWPCSSCARWGGSPSARGRPFGDLQIAWLAADDLAGVSSGRGLAELGGYEVDDYEG